MMWLSQKKNNFSHFGVSSYDIYDMILFKPKPTNSQNKQNNAVFPTKNTTFTTIKYRRYFHNLPLAKTYLLPSNTTDKLVGCIGV